MKDSRIEERSNTINKLLNEIRERKRSERLRYKKYYNIDLDNEKQFDLIINTSHFSADEVASIIIQYLIDKGVLNV